VCRTIVLAHIHDIKEKKADKHGLWGRLMIVKGHDRDGWACLMIVLILLLPTLGVGTSIAADGNRPVIDPSSSTQVIGESGSSISDRTSSGMGGISVSSHILGQGEMQLLQERIGTREEGVDYSITVNGRRTGLAPPTQEQWNDIVGNMKVLESVSGRGPGAPSSYDLSLSPFFPVVGDQGFVGSCSAWAAIYYDLGFLEAKDNGWVGASAGLSENLLSPLWTYNKVNEGVDEGSSMYDNMMVSKTWGVATLATMPYGPDFLSWGDQNAFREAPLHRSAEIFSIPFSGQSTVDQVRELICSGLPITFVVDAGQVDGGFHDGNFIVSSEEYQSTTWNHAQTLVGYDDSMGDDGEIGAFKVVNSYGRSFADNGYYWITYDAFMEIGDNLFLTYLTDIPSYQPSLLATWDFDYPPSRDVPLAISVLDSSSDATLGIIEPYRDPHDYNLLPTFMCLDISELEHIAGASDALVQIELGEAATAGCLSSFKIERYSDEYQNGMASRISAQALNLPACTPTVVFNNLPEHVSISISAALGAANHFSTYGDAGWVPERENWLSGGWALQSGNIGDDGSSVLKVNAVGPGSISFYALTSSQPECDLLIFSVDGIEQFVLSGETQWTQFTTLLSEGTHSLTWEYVTDESVSVADDCAYLEIDQILQQDDEFEPNDDVSTAAYLSFGRYSDMRCLDDDLFRIQTGPGDSFFATLEVDVSKGDLDLSLLDSDGLTVLSSSWPGSEKKQVHLIGSGFGGVFYLRVRALEGDVNEYALEIERADDMHMDIAGWEWHYNYGAPQTLTHVVRVGGVTAVNIPSTLDGRTPLSSIAAGCFDDIEGHAVTAVLSMPGSLASIGEGAFSRCAVLASVVFGRGLHSIGANAFSDCQSLRSLSFTSNDPPAVGAGWISGINPLVEGHAREASSFPYPGAVWSNLRFGSSFRLPEDDFAYEVRNGKVLISGYLKQDTAVAIPAILDGYPVDEIGDSAFYGCPIESISIPAGVTKIGAFSFSGCYRITEVVIPDSVEFIGESAFSECFSLRKVIIGNGTTAIPAKAFYSCNALCDLRIGGKVGAIDMGAFEYCSALSSLIIPDCCKILGAYAFAYCVSLQNVDLGGGVFLIGGAAFHSCNLLASIEIPVSVASIGNGAFDSCPSLESIDVNEMNRMFSNHERDGVLFNKDVTEILMYPVGNPRPFYELPEAVRVVHTGAFQYCTNLRSVMFGPLVRGFGGNGYFLGCSSLVSISVDDNNPVIADYDGALYTKDLSILMQYPVGNEAESFVMPDSVQIVAGRAFASCDSLRTVKLSNQLGIIWEGAFQGCISLTTIEIPMSVREIQPYAFAGCSALTSVALSANIPSLEAGVFLECISLVSLSLPDSTTSIGQDAMAGCISLQEIIFGDGVFEILSRSFYGCSSLRSVTIPASVCTISGSAFAECTSLVTFCIDEENADFSNFAGDGVLYDKTLTKLLQYPSGNLNTIFIVPAPIREIGPQAFSRSSFLRSVVTSENMTRINAFAFSGCSQLTSLLFAGRAPDVEATWLSGAPSEIRGHAAVGSGFPAPGSSWNGLIMGGNIPYCEYVLSEANATVTGYFGLGGTYSIPAHIDGYPITKIAEGAFDNPLGHLLTSIVMPSTLTEIGRGSFHSCQMLASVTIGRNVVSIGDGSFEDCTSLRSISFLGMVAPTTVGINWIGGAPADVLGHASSRSDFPPSGGLFHGLLMGSPIAVILPPQMPVGLTLVSEGDHMFITWSPPIDDGGAAIDQYVIYLDGVEVARSISLSHEITKAAMSHLMSIAAINAAGEGPVASICIPSTPDVPTSQTVTIVGQNRTLSWSVPSSDGGSPIMFYAIYRNNSEGIPMEIGRVDAGQALLFEDAVAGGGMFDYSIAAVNMMGEGPRVFASIGNEPPSAPVGLSVLTNGTSVFLAWSPPIDDGGTQVLGYRLYRSSSTEAERYLGWTEGPAFTDSSGIVAGRTYDYRVISFNSAGNGAGTNATIAIGPSSPISLIATPRDGSVFLTWQPPIEGGSGIEYYVVFKNGVDILHTLTTNVTINGLENGHAYSFSVAAQGNCLGIQSATVTATPTVEMKQTSTGFGSMTFVVIGVVLIITLALVVVLWRRRRGG
jgi:hypothetical protein